MCLCPKALWLACGAAYLQIWRSYMSWWAHSLLQSKPLYMTTIWVWHVMHHVYICDQTFKAKGWRNHCGMPCRVLFQLPSLWWGSLLSSLLSSFISTNEKCQKQSTIKRSEDSQQPARQANPGHISGCFNTWSSITITVSLFHEIRWSHRMRKVSWANLKLMWHLCPDKLEAAAKTAQTAYGTGMISLVTGRLVTTFPDCKACNEHIMWSPSQNGSCCNIAWSTDIDGAWCCW